jgi:methylmalonyl-CoA mutase N-terminal domain/subunit
VAAIEAGYQKREIEQSAYDVATSVEDGSRTVVGVNRFQRPADEVYEPLRVDPTIEAQQVERLAALRADRDAAEVERHLDALRAAAEGDANVLYPMHDALRARATVGEVCNVLRAVWGTYQPADAF